MSKWCCYSCSKKFGYPKEIVTTYEDFVGVSNVFPTKTPMRILICPYCNSDEISMENVEDEE